MFYRYLPHLDSYKTVKDCSDLEIWDYQPEASHAFFYTGQSKPEEPFVFKEVKVDKRGNVLP